MAGALSLLTLTLLCLAANAALGLLKANSAADRDAVLAFHGYAMAFFGFVVGFTAWARARAHSSGTPRLLLAVALFFAFVGPWIGMAVTGLVTREHGRAILIASPSPSFAVTMVQAVSTPLPEAGLILAAGSACAAAWALIGVGLFAAASLRVRALLESERRARAATERAFADEDAALLAGAPGTLGEA